MRRKHFTRFIYILPLLLVLAAASWGYAKIHKHYLVVDEKAHYAQTKLFSYGEWNIYIKKGETYPRNAMFPGFHVILGTAARITGFRSPDFIRFLLTLNAVLLFYAAYLILTFFTDKERSLICAAQIFFLPLLFPFHFLIYTDSTALTAILFTVYFMLKKKMIPAALSAFLIIFIRHNYIVLLPFFILYPYITEYGFKLDKNGIQKHILRALPFIVPFGAFTVFLIINGRPTLDDPASHIPTISAGNIIFALFLFICIYIPIFFFRRSYISKIILRDKTFIAAVMAFVLLAAFFFRIRHHWNTFPWLLHNELLAWIVRDTSTRIVFACALVAALLLIAGTLLETKAAYLIYPFSMLLLIPILLIEPRYYILPFTLFNIFRKKESPGKERVLLYYMAAAAVVLYKIQVSTAYVL